MPLGPEKAALNIAIAVTEAHRLCQFGQKNDDAAWDGRTACTHVICQILALLWRDRLLTINQVNTFAGMPYKAKAANGRARGMNNLEFQRFCNALNIPMEVRFSLDYETLLRWSNKAPVFKGARYESAPEKKGYRYNGRIARPPFAVSNGATQLGSRVGRHAELILGYRSVISTAGKITGYREWRVEPNHGSQSRPERYPYDVILTSQGKQEYDDYGLVGGSPYAALPTRSLV